LALFSGNHKIQTLAHCYLGKLGYNL